MDGYMVDKIMRCKCGSNGKFTSDLDISGQARYWIDCKDNSCQHYTGCNYTAWKAINEWNRMQGAKG